MNPKKDNLTEKLVIRLKREGRNGGSNVLRLVCEAKTHSIVSNQDAGDAESTEWPTARQIFKRRIYAWNAFFFFFFFFFRGQHPACRVLFWLTLSNKHPSEKIRKECIETGRLGRE